MSTTLVLVQILNGLQLGVLLFLIAAGLTLVFGVMDFINLAHGVQYMLGAYLAVAFYGLVGNFFFALVLAVWGAAPLTLPVPEFFTGSIVLMSGLLYPVWRLVIIASGLAIAAGLYVLVTYTRIGMLVRAGATNARMVSALGVNIERLFMIVFGFGTMLAGFAGIMIAPIISVEPGMGDNILILAFVVIVIGGIGSIRGAFIAALLIGLVDTLGRFFAPTLLRALLDPSAAS